MKIFIVLTMLFCHVLADYNLQGVLANMKQRRWWKEQGDYKLFRYDYLAALIMHSISWTFMVMLPIAFYCWISMMHVSVAFLAVFVVNTLVHAFVDNWKCNWRGINLLTDQLLHIFQIVITAMLFLY